VRGLRVHITGSAAAEGSDALIARAHSFIRALAAETIAYGGGLVLGAGGEPRNETGQPCIFDWTALEVIADAPDPAPGWPLLRPERFVVVVSQRGLDKIPANRAETWERCCRRSDFQLVVAPPGWRMAGIIRERQVLRGDILLVLGGGAGAEHLAELYSDEGKPVVPVRADLGAYCHDGNGGSRFLHARAISDPDNFFRLRDGAGSATARISNLLLRTDTDTDTMARQVAQLLADLRPRPAFYVRLLDASHDDYPAVERFFRDVVDTVVVEHGFTPYEMGRGSPQAAFMNVEIFESIHRAGLVVVDLTGVRPNCTMELGYALARRRRVVISARKGTKLPFDEDKLPTCIWEDTGARTERLDAYRRWFDRNSELPPVVE
jgi:hypothetical protein